MVWIGRDFKDHLISTPLPWTETPSTGPGCSKVLSLHLWSWSDHQVLALPKAGKIRYLKSQTVIRAYFVILKGTEDLARKIIIIIMLAFL